MQKIEFFKHTIGQEEKDAVAEALSGAFLTTGKIVNEFEDRFAEFVGAQYAVGLNSCTAALHLALLACHVGEGDEVITTPMTFVATSLAIIHCDAVPVWVDVEPTTGNIDASKIEKAITKKTKAILPVHLYGQMCDMRSIRKIADKYKLAVIEDAAHSLIAQRAGIRVGQLADACCFSFYATKSITCGEGGALTTNIKEIFDFVKRNRSHGLTSDAASRYTGNYQHWDVIDLGWKYNMDNIKASMLIPQLNKANKQRLYRKKICELYKENLRDCSQVTYPYIFPESEDNKSDYHLFTIWVDQRDDLLEYLQNKGIGVAVNYRSINTLTALRYAPEVSYRNECKSVPNSEQIGDSTLTLPLHCFLTSDNVTDICNTIKEFFK